MPRRPPPPPEHGSTHPARGPLEILRGDRAGGWAMAGATMVALAWANWPGSLSYLRVWRTVAPWSGPLGLNLDYRSWINEGLMLVFFTVVGLEIRREVIVGELRTWRRASQPVLAALCGMAVPAALFAAIEAGGPAARAWAIPTATDVAFALGALALVAGRRGVRGRTFLMTLAVADDVFSIVLLSLLYSHGLRPAPLVVGLSCMVAMVGLRLVRAPASSVVGLGLVAWWAMLHSGVEAALVGAVIGAAAPTWPLDRHGAGPRRWELRLEPVVNGLVLPVFALANAGLRLEGSGLGGTPALRVLVAVVVARLVGKPVGIVGAGLVGRRGRSSAADHLPPPTLAGLGLLASIGFTVPLLVVRAALPDGPLAAGAIAGLLVSTVIGGAGGAVLVRRHSLVG